MPFVTGPTSTVHLLELLPLLIPASRTTSSTPSASGPSTKLLHPTDAVAALVHAIQTALKFRLVIPPGQVADDLGDRLGVNDHTKDADGGDDTRSEADTAVEDDDEGEAGNGSEASTVYVTNQEVVANILPQSWNARGEDAYTFSYKHEQSGMTFMVKVGRLGGRINVTGMAENGEPIHFNAVLSDLVKEDFFPWPRSDEAAGSARSPKDGFTSESKINDFVNKYLSEIVAKFVPGLSIPGYTQAPPSAPSGSGPTPSRGPAPSPMPRHPAPPRPGSFPGYPGSSGQNPASIGRRDLDPFAGNPGGLAPGGILRDDRGGGSIVDFNHPLFDGRRGEGGSGIESGPGGMIQPPGARWDPVGPGFPGGGFGGRGGFPSAGGNPLGGVGMGDPDFDELLPPGERGPDLGMPGQRGGRGGGQGGSGRGGFSGGPFSGNPLGGGGSMGGGSGGFGGFYM